jgi:hypothetical protein
VRLLVWAEGRGTVALGDSAARAELQGAPKQKLLQLKKLQKKHWVKHLRLIFKNLWFTDGAKCGRWRTTSFCVSR